MNPLYLRTSRLPTYAAAIAAALTLPLSPAISEDKTQPPGFPTPVAKTGEAPAMSDIPKMKEQGERMAVLMEKLTRESDPAERRRIMAEAMCPQ